MKTIDYIEELRYNWNRISGKQEKAIIDYFGENIDEELTEQEVWEQTRKIIQSNENRKLVFVWTTKK